ncbi:MAG: DUF2911 domain-containing protein [Bacteroidota bacterium]|nr:DUF2911 domain-containing protein [Bacteroidota bacterium]
MKIARLQPVILMTLVFFISCKENEKPAVAKAVVSTDSIPNINDETVVNRYAPVDVSPMDMSYFPIDYPKLKMTDNNIAPPIARVIYSRPHLEGRQLFHDVLKYGERWRLGANEATELDLYREVTIQNKKVKPGRYVLYCILGPDKWSMVLNSNIDSWGLKQDTTKDIQHFDIPVTHGNPPLEYFTMVFEKTDKGADLIMAWDDVLAKLPINF